MYEGFEMRERHRQIITKNRLYLLHNMCVTEELWAKMIANELLSFEMVEECKVRYIRNTNIPTKNYGTCSTYMYTAEGTLYRHDSNVSINTSREITLEFL